MTVKAHTVGYLSCVLVLCLVLTAFVTAVPAQDNTPAASRVLTPYVVEPGDVLEVFVWKEEDLSRKVLVRPDGYISFPLVQDLQAAGVTPVDLKKSIEERLKEFVAAPNVTVIVDSIRSYTIFVVGKVQKPGEYTREQPVSVLQSISLAGGFQEYADRGGITVFRNTAQGNVVFKFNYDDVVRGKNPSQNITLQSGDVVVIP